MKKRKFSITIITDNNKKDYNLLGEYDKENGIIYYNENEDLVTSMQINLKNKTLIRENKDYYIEYQLIENKETLNKVIIKELDKVLEIRIKTEKFDIADNKVEIVYTIVDSKEKIKYQIEF